MKELSYAARIAFFFGPNEKFSFIFDVLGDDERR